jgi:hypothetical protein
MHLTSFFRPLKKHLTDVSQSRVRGFMPLRSAAALLSTLTTTAVMIASLVCLRWVVHQAVTPDLVSPSGSGVVIRTEVTAIWVPQALRDLARHQAGPPVDRSPEEVQTYLARNGWRNAWYALTCRGHQVNGGFGEVTQIRWLSEAADHLDELQAVMATAAGRLPRFEDGRFSHTRVEVIPDTLQAVDSREAITRLMAELVVGGKNLPPGGPDSTRNTE